jgi:nitrite reductase (NADH) small subunit
MTALQGRPAELHGLVPVCRLSDLQPDRGVAALLPDNEQVAVFLLSDGALYALANVDPFSGAAVLSRGIVGDRAGIPVVVSPVYKQAFELSTGICVEQRDMSVRVYRVEHVDGMVWVGPQ